MKMKVKKINNIINPNILFHNQSIFFSNLCTRKIKAAVGEEKKKNAFWRDFHSTKTEVPKIYDLKLNNQTSYLL